MDVVFDKKLLPIIEASGYPPAGYWVPEDKRTNPLPPADTLPPDTSYHMRLIRQVIHQKPQRILEVGTRLGSTIIAMLSNCQSSAVCIDIFAENTREDLENNLSDFGLLNRVAIMSGDSRQLLPVLMEAYEPDLVHIDGDHRYDAVLHDISAATEATKPPQWVVVHDLICPDVAAAWDSWHTFQLRTHQWNADVDYEVHNYPGFLELRK